MRTGMPGGLSLAVTVVGLLAVSGALTLRAQPRPRSSSLPYSRTSSKSAAPHLALVDEYCLSCHDEDHKKGGLALDTVAAEDVAKHPEVWEKVVRKLRARQMPPVGKERPDEATYDAVIASLETSLDRAAAAHPNPGRTATHPPAHPNRIPERHPRSARARRRRRVAAAGRRVQLRLRQRDGRRSVADAAGPLRVGGGEDQPRSRSDVPSRSPGGETIRIQPDLTQEEHLDGLPIGTRGGAVVPYTFPLDGEYEIQIRLTRDRDEHVEGLERAARPRAAAGSTSACSCSRSNRRSAAGSRRDCTTIARNGRPAPEDPRAGEGRSARARRGVSEKTVGAARDAAAALPGALQFLPASADSAGDLFRSR